MPFRVSSEVPSAHTPENLQPRNARHPIKMRVSGEKHQIMLNNERCDPKVVRGNRCAGASQFSVEFSVEVGRSLVRPQHIHAMRSEEPAQGFFVASCFAPMPESGAKFTKDCEGQQQLRGRPHWLERLFDSCDVVAIPVCIERQS